MTNSGWSKSGWVTALVGLALIGLITGLLLSGTHRWNAEQAAALREQGCRIVGTFRGRGEGDVWACPDGAIHIRVN